MKFWLFGIVFMAQGLFAADIKKDLGAGGTFNYVTKWDRIEIKCTSNPITPTILARFCGCSRKYEGNNVYRFHLTSSVVLSNGTVVTSPVTDKSTDKECEDSRREDYKDVCPSANPVTE